MRIYLLVGRYPVKVWVNKGMGLEKDMALEKRHGARKKGMALGKRGMARRHAKRGWGKHYRGREFEPRLMRGSFQS